MKFHSDIEFAFSTFMYGGAANTRGYQLAALRDTGLIMRHRFVDGDPKYWPTDAGLAYWEFRLAQMPG
jgi:hypothetical protein